MSRDKSTAQPHRKMTEADWERLLKEVETRKDVAVDRLCQQFGVSRQRFYKKYPGGKRPEAAA